MQNGEPVKQRNDVCVCVLSFIIFPAGKLETVKWVFTWPLSFVLYFTVPNCNKPRWEKWFMVTFASSTLWIAAFSYMMVWMVSASRTPRQHSASVERGIHSARGEYGLGFQPRNWNSQLL